MFNEKNALKGSACSIQFFIICCEKWHESYTFDDFDRFDVSFNGIYFPVNLFDEGDEWIG